MSYRWWLYELFDPRVVGMSIDTHNKTAHKRELEVKFR